MGDFHDVMDIINVCLGIGSVIFSCVAGCNSWQVNRKLKREQRRQNKKVKIKLVCGSKNYELPVEVRRAEFSRAEVLGLLGMIPLRNKEQKNFFLGYLNTSNFRSRFNEILEGSNDTILQISCNEEEYNQFDFDNIQN
jgi:hypothetical protein